MARIILVSGLIFLWANILPAQNLWFNDEFTRYRPHWQQAGPGTAEVNEDKLNLSHSQPEGHLALRLDQYLSSLDNFTLETEITASEQSLNGEYGLIWASNREADRYFAFLIRPEGDFAIVKRDREDTRYLVDWTRSRRIKGPGKPNTLTIRRVNWAYYFDVNGKEVARVDFQPFMGLYHGFWLEGNMELSVEYFRIFHPEVEPVLVNDMMLEAEFFPLDTPLNRSEFHESAPTLSRNGRRYYFTRSDTATGYDAGTLMWAEVLGDTAWSEPAPVFPSETASHQSLTALNADANRAWILSWAANGEVRLEERVGGGETWSSGTAQRIPDLGQQHRPVSAWLLDDGNTLIFSAELPGGEGDQDLWVSEKLGEGSWSKPRNLGPEVNSFGREAFPYFDERHQLLYFSSDGRHGYGGMDLYRIERGRNWRQWNARANLGPKVNGRGDQLSLTPHPFRERSYYLVSQDSLEDDLDVYRLRVPRSLTEQGLARLHGTVRNRQTNQLVLNSVVHLAYIRPDTLIDYTELPADSGKFEGLIHFGESYQLYPSAPGYYPISDTLNLRPVKGFRVVEKTVYLMPIEEGATIALQRVYFVRAQAVLLPESFAELRNLVRLMQDNPGMEIEVRGHTDNVGPEDALQVLSEARAATVRQYLINRGIHPARIRSIGFGSTRPIADNANPETRPLNRRVEFRVLKL